MKLYIRRYIHHIGGLPDPSALRFTRYNQYESMILLTIKMDRFGVQFHSSNAKVSMSISRLAEAWDRYVRIPAPVTLPISKKQANHVACAASRQFANQEMVTRIDLTARIHRAKH